MRKVIGIGETILDIIFRGNQPHAAVPGGSVFNGLVSLSRLDVPVHFISELGNDQVGELIRRFMLDNGLTTDYIDCFPDGKSPISLAFLNEANDAQYSFYKDYPKQRLEVDLPEIREDDIFILGSYYALNPVLRERMIEILDYARAKGAIIYYDPNFRNAHAHEAIRLTPTILENMEYADIVRGSDEDFLNIFGPKPIEEIYRDRVQFYCNQLIVTYANRDIRLFSGKEQQQYQVPVVQTVSTIGAGDNFNAGILFGLLKQNIRRADIATLTPEKWTSVIRCGIDLATAVCQSYDNYISPSFAADYRSKS